MSIIPLHAALIRGVCRDRDGLCRSGVARISGKGVVSFFGTHTARGRASTWKIGLSNLQREELRRA
jgi:hypothetical protein